MFKSFNTKKIDHTKQTMFFGETPNMARYDVMKYPWFDNQTNEILGSFWRPEEIQLNHDARQFKESLSAFDQSIVVRNLQRQIVLDSIQGRSLSVALLPVVSLPELETLIETWAWNETIHSRTYTWIIKNVFSNPAEIFDGIMDNKRLVSDIANMTKYYDDYLLHYHKWLNKEIKLKTLKRKFWMMLNSINALEGIRFYSSFVCTWAFKEIDNVMMGNADLISLICRDENMHLAITQQMLKLMPEEDSDFKTIKKECEDEVYSMFTDVMNEEKSWNKYLFEDGSRIGLNEIMLNQYDEHIGNKRLKALGMSEIFEQSSRQNPLPWVSMYTNSGGKQPAPQEKDIINYQNDAIDKSGFKPSFKKKLI